MMQRLKMLFLASIAIVALGATMAASAYAGTEALNSEKKATAVTFTGNSAEETKLQVLGNSLQVKCAKTVTEGSLEASGKLGPFHLHFETCTTSVGGTCTGTGDAAGSILALGVIHIASNLALTEGYIDFLIEQLHFECNPLGIKALFLVKGAYICKITPINTATTNYTVTCNNNGTVGDPQITTYEDDSGVEGKLTATTELLTQENTGEFKMSAEVGSGKITSTQSVQLDI